MTDSFLDDAGNVIKVVPELYEDGLQSTVQESAGAESNKCCSCTIAKMDWETGVFSSGDRKVACGET